MMRPSTKSITKNAVPMIEVSSQSRCTRGTGTPVEASALIIRNSRSTWCADWSSVPGGFLRMTQRAAGVSSRKVDSIARRRTVAPPAVRESPASARADRVRGDPRRSDDFRGRVLAHPQPALVRAPNFRLLLATALNLGLRDVGVNRVDMRFGVSLYFDARDHTPPAELFSDVVGAALGLEFHFVLAAVGLHTAHNFLSRRNYERMIAPRTDPRRILATGNVGAERRADVIVRPVHVDDGVTGRRLDFFEWLALDGASDRERDDDAKQQCQQSSIHWQTIHLSTTDAVRDLPALAAACANLASSA